jgi:hypothetical protein
VRLNIEKLKSGDSESTLRRLIVWDSAPLHRATSRAALTPIACVEEHHASGTHGRIHLVEISTLSLCLLML